MDDVACLCSESAYQNVCPFILVCGPISSKLIYIAGRLSMHILSVRYGAFWVCPPPHHLSMYRNRQSNRLRCSARSQSRLTSSKRSRISRRCKTIWFWRLWGFGLSIPNRKCSISYPKCAVPITKCWWPILSKSH